MPVAEVRLARAIFRSLLLACVPVLGLCLLCLAVLLINPKSPFPLLLLSVITLMAGIAGTGAAPQWAAHQYRPRVPAFWLIIIFFAGLVLNAMIGVFFLLVATSIASSRGPSF